MPGSPISVDAPAVLADPAALLPAHAQLRIARVTRELAESAGVDLRWIVLPRVDRATVTAVLNSALPVSLASEYTGTSLAPLASAIDELIREANATCGFRRGFVSRNMLHERLGLAAAPAHRLVTLLVSARERYVSIEAPPVAAVQLSMRDWMLAARRAGLAARTMLETGGAPLRISGGIGGSERFARLAGSGPSSAASAWATAVTDALGTAALWSGRVTSFRRYVLLLAGITAVAFFMRDLLRRRAGLAAERKRYLEWRRLVESRRRRADDDDNCTICLGLLREQPASTAAEDSPPRSPASPHAIAVRSGAMPHRSPSSGERQRQSQRPETVVCACSHEFHRECAARWLATQDTCPLCRAENPLPQALPPDVERVMRAAEAAEKAPIALRAVQQPLVAARLLATLVRHRLAEYRAALAGTVHGMSLRERALVLRLLLHEWPSLVAAATALSRAVPRLLKATERHASAMAGVLPTVGVAFFEILA